MVKVSFSKSEYKYLKGLVDTEDIKFSSVTRVASRNSTIKENSKIVDSLREKLSNAEPSNSYTL